MSEKSDRRVHITVEFITITYMQVPRERYESSSYEDRLGSLARVRQL